MNELKWRDDCYCQETLFGVAALIFFMLLFSTLAFAGWEITNIAEVAWDFSTWHDVVVAVANFLMNAWGWVIMVFSFIVIVWMLGTVFGIGE